MSKPLLLVLGDQLSLSLTTLQDAPDNAVVALCEVAEEARYVPHHIHKIGFFWRPCVILPRPCVTKASESI